jgi:hypothetical protein
VADQQNRVAFLGEADGFEMDLGDERAGGVNGVEIARAGCFADGRGDTVSAVKDDLIRGDFVDAIHEDDAALLEAFNDMAVVYDLVINIKRSAEKLQRALEAVYRHVDAGAEAARIGENDFHANPPWI